MTVAGIFDVAGRLAEGQPAVDDFARYTSACQALGACGHDLTDRVERSYASEAGLNLHALDADHAALRAAVAAVRDAQQLQDSQLNALSAAWTGAGADAAAEFLRRHSVASTQAVTALTAAADQVGALRDELWRLVDAKVAAAEAVDARTDGVRGEWLAAAETVTTGMGDRAAASELVDAQVKPFVAQDVRAEWVAAMEAASEAIAHCFDKATTAVRSEAPVGFPEPGGAWAPAVPPPDGAWAPAAPLAAPSPAAPLAMTEPAAATAPPPVPPMPSAGAMPGAGAMPSMGSGLTGASGISGLGQQLGEMISGLVPTVGDALGELPEPEDLERDEELDNEEEELEDESPEDEEDEETEEKEDPDEGEAEPEEPTEVAPEKPVSEAEPEAEPLPEPEPPAPTPAPVAPLAAPVAPVPGPASGTPCEIAANEVPQVGE